MSAKITAIVVPYELGRLREGVGRGAERLLERGAVEALASSGATVTTDLVEIDPRFAATGLGEGDSAFELIRTVAERVRVARGEGAFPVMLGGSCFNAVGVVAGLDERAPGVVWFDAHSDFSEPVTSTSGYFDSMGVAVLTGSAWQGMLAEVPGARPVPETAVVLAGARAFDPSERARLDASDIVELTIADLADPASLVAATEALTPEVSGIYLHLDLDVLDTGAAPVNIYSEPGGLAAEQFVGLVATLLERFPIRGVSLTVYDPSVDPDDRLPPIAMKLLRTIAAHVPG